MPVPPRELARLCVGPPGLSRTPAQCTRFAGPPTQASRISSDMATIRLEGLCKRYGTVEAVRDLTLTCADGELLALLGPSGCGKTSTLKMVAGIEHVSAGEIYFGDRPVTALDAAERNVAMVFEDYALYPHLTVAANIAFPLEIRGQA